jgi:hypothetical protein
MLKKTMNNWWLYVHTDVLSARENNSNILPKAGLWCVGGGGSKSDCVFMSLNKAAL